MWELLKSSARGRISVRRFPLLVTAILVAIFSLSTILSPVAFAADAERNGSNLVHEGRTLAPMSDAQRPSGVPQDVAGFVFVDNSAGKAYFIFTTDDPSSATAGEYVIYDFTPPQNFSNPSPPETISIVQSTTSTTPVSGCNSNVVMSVGWVVCPVVNFLASGMDHLFEVLSGFLVVQPAQANNTNSLYRMWTIVRDIANVCFVIAFLIIVFSQVTSLGISNYGIKRTLPRLILAAVLVNISFWICAIAIDISNMLGYGVHSMFMSVFDQLNSDGLYSEFTWTNVSESVLSGVAVGGLAAAGVFIALDAGIVGTLIMLIPTLVGVLLAILVALLVISVRQALITVLVIISPLAFVAYLLPNTEKYFDKWKDLFLTLLLVYPAFSLIFGGAQLAGLAIIQNAGGSINLIILGMAVQVAPVVVTPMLIKLSGNLVGRIAGMVNNPKAGLIDRTRNWAKDRSAMEKARVLAGANRFPNSFSSRATRHLDSRRRNREGLRKVWEGTADNNFAASQHGQRIRDLEEANGVDKKRIDNTWLNSANGRRLTLESSNLDVDKQNINTHLMGSVQGQQLRRRQMDSESYKVETENDFGRTHIGHQAHIRHERATIDKTRVETAMRNTADGRILDTERREVERDKQTTDANLEQAWHFRNLTDAGSQTREMNLRIAADKSAKDKLKVDTVYSEIKAKDISNALVSRSVADSAYDIAEETALTTIRQAGAAGKLKTIVNKELLKDGKTYQTDPVTNEVVLDPATNKPIVINQKMIDGKSLQQYATGIGKREITLAAEVEKSRKDDGLDMAASLELMRHFNLSSNDYYRLAVKDGSRPIEKVDNDHNAMEFTIDDEAAQQAAISWIAKNGAYSQRRELALTSGDGGVNEKLSGFITSELISNGFGSMAPWGNDITIDEMGQGRIRNMTDIKFHDFRQIHEGRQKAEGMAGANNGALAELYSIFNERAANSAEWHEYLRLNEEMIDRQMEGKPQAQIDAAKQEFRDMIERRFDAKYHDLIEETERILNEPQLRARTNAQSRAEMERAIADYRNSTIGRSQIDRRERLRLARERVANGTQTPDDIALIAEQADIYKK